MRGFVDLSSWITHWVDFVIVGVKRAHRLCLNVLDGIVHYATLKKIEKYRKGFRAVCGPQVFYVGAFPSLSLLFLLIWVDCLPLIGLANFRDDDRMYHWSSWNACSTFGKVVLCCASFWSLVFWNHRSVQSPISNINSRWCLLVALFCLVHVLFSNLHTQYPHSPQIDHLAKSSLTSVKL